MSQATCLDGLVAELDILIRARYGLISVSTFEEMRFRRLMNAVAHLPRHKSKGLFTWSRVTGLHQVSGTEPLLNPRPIPDTEDPFSVLDYIGGADSGLFVLSDFGPYLAPFGQPEPQLVRRLRELAWAIKTRPVTVLFVDPDFPDIPALEKALAEATLASSCSSGVLEISPSASWISWLTPRWIAGISIG